MFEEYEKKRRKQVSFMRSLLDYGIGLMIVCLGVFFIFRDKLGMDLPIRRFQSPWEQIFGIMCVAYGAWRIYRGYKKNYFRDDE